MPYILQAWQLQPNLTIGLSIEIEQNSITSQASLSKLIQIAITNMAISTLTIQFNEYELEIISSALADYRDYAEGATDPILARCDAIDDKIDEAFKNQ